MKLTQLEVWQSAMELAVSIYNVTSSFPGDEKYGLTAQMRRAAISIPSNIAEGEGRFSTGDHERFLLISRGSLLELETQIILARRLQYLDQDLAVSLLESTGEVGRLLNGSLRFLKKPSAERRPPTADNR